jgi:hypothetical protein
MTFGLLAVASVVLETETFVVPTCLGESGEHLGVDRHPGSDEGHDRPLQRGDATPDAGRENVLQLGESS